MDNIPPEAQGISLFKRGLECRDCDQYQESIKHFEKALFIYEQIGSRCEEAWSHCYLGRSFYKICQYERASEHYEKALGIREITGFERQRLEGRVYNNIGEVHHVRKNYEEARRYYEKALAISIEIQCEREQAVSYNNLGALSHCQGKLDDALVFHKKSLEIRKKKGCSEEEIMSYINIGQSYEARGEHKTALQYYEKGVVVSKKISDRRLERTNLDFIIKIYRHFCQYEKVLEYQERALEIKSEIGEKTVKVLVELGLCHVALGDYEKGIQRLEQGIKLSEEEGDVESKAACYHSMGKAYGSLGDDDKAMTYLKQCIGIYQTTGDDVSLGVVYSDIGDVCWSVGLYQKAFEYLEKALKTSKEIESRVLEATSLVGLGNLNFTLGKLDKAADYGEKALQIAKEIFQRSKQISSYVLLGNVQLAQGHNEKAIEYQIKALEMMKEMGKKDQQQFIALQCLGLAYASQGGFSKACEFLLESIKHHQSRRTSLEDETKLLLDGLDFSSYKVLSWILFHQSKVNAALFTLELGRGRALVDLIAKKYGIQGSLGTNEVNLSALQSLFKNQKRNFLFIAVLQNIIALWFVDINGNIKFKKGSEIEFSKGKKNYVAEDFGVDASKLVIDDQEVQCEDRTLSALYDDGSLAAVEQAKKSKKHGVRKGGERKENDQSYLQYTCKAYSVFIAPIVDLIDYPEIIIAAEGPIFHTPFALLKDENGKYLSESVRIRLIPSLTTLKLILDSPADYHCQTGALIVGEPKVGPVEFKGNIVELPPLPKAREEAKMVARLLGVSCLVGEQATKEEVLRRIQEVSLVHIAAHGDAERGEIALAPNSSVIGTPKKDDFMLTMKDIAKVGIKAKLVVLSCCHSASGKILKAEGVVGIARAFLGSGARSVLMSLWAVDDDATKAFMNIFYKCLICEKLSASEALHQAMKKMRESLLYNDVKHWAPFVLLGDDVSLDF